MPLSAEDAAHVWSLFKDSPLWIKWPEFQADVAQNLDRRLVTAGETIYRPGDPADRLFLVGSGTIVQEIEREGRVWFQRILKPGDFFGQQSLFSEVHQTRATARGDTELYVMTAADLRVALEKNRDLHDSLLHETRTARLRSVPLLESMGDSDIRWLGQEVTEVEIAAGQAVPLRDQRGLWIIDWGQVSVTGPAGFGRPDWRFTAGNFFLSPELRAPTQCVVDSATATVKTHLFHLAEQHLHRLLAGFPEIARMIGQPVDIVKILHRVPRLADGAHMSDKHLLHLAQFCAWAFVPAGLNITTQGSVGYSFIVLNKGAALVSAVDDQGRLRPRNTLRPGEYFGFTSLLESKPRDATVRAIRAPAAANQTDLNGAEIIILDRRDLQFAFNENPDLWHPGVWLFDKYLAIKEQHPAFDWLEEGKR